MSFGDGLALEREFQQPPFESSDAREGLSADIDKRNPTFTVTWPGPRRHEDTKKIY